MKLKRRESKPIKIRGFFAFIPRTIISAAWAGVVRSRFLSSFALLRSISSSDKSTFSPIRAFFTMLVLTPPGCIAETAMFVPSSSWRRDSVKPRTANLLAQ